MKNHLKLHSKKTHHAFTLIELLIVIAILGIVMTIGVGAYTEYSKRIADEYGKLLVNEVMAAQKVAFIHKRRYFENFTAIGYANENVMSEFNYFKASISKCGTEKVTRCIMVAATPLTEKSTGTTFILDSNGNRLPLDKW
jgi:prepilin-type N-terminal cleavage/methylation domain-containing protein